MKLKSETLTAAFTTRTESLENTITRLQAELQEVTDERDTIKVLVKIKKKPSRDADISQAVGLVRIPVQLLLWNLN